VLHLLLTLSDRFIIALCTNPPKPFVGDTGLSGRLLVCVGKFSAGRADASFCVAPSAGMSLCELEKGKGDRFAAAVE
jgi:hypothetical protein